VHTKYVEGFSCPAMCRGLGEGHRGLTCEAVQRLLHGGLVAVLEEQLADEGCMDADGAVVAWVHPRRGLGASEIGQGVPGLGHHRRHVEQLGDPLISPSLGDDHSAIGVPAQHDGRLGLGDGLSGCVDIGVEIPETVPGLAAAGQRHRVARDSVPCERFGHPAPPPRRVADARAVDEDQRWHAKSHPTRL
jgi:hypothetical protein